MNRMNRRSFLKNCVRGGALAGLVGLCGALAAREQKFECGNSCGECQKFKNGKCVLGIK
jgi:hypothetical protein